MAAPTKGTLLDHLPNSAIACPFWHVAATRLAILEKTTADLSLSYTQSHQGIVNRSNLCITHQDLMFSTGRTMLYTLTSGSLFLFKCRVSLYAYVYLIIFSTWDPFYQVWRSTADEKHCRLFCSDTEVSLIHQYRNEKCTSPTWQKT